MSTDSPRADCVRINGIDFKRGSLKMQRGYDGSIVIWGNCGRRRPPIWNFPTWQAAHAFVSKLESGQEFKVSEDGRVLTLA